MTTLKEANQVRIALKMKLSHFCWFILSESVLRDGDYYIVIKVKKINDSIRKQIPPVINGVMVKTELE